MEPFKNALGEAAVAKIARALAKAAPTFDTAAFRKDALKGLTELELKPRVEHIADCIRNHTPALATLVKVGEQSSSLRGFAAWPLIEAVTRWDDFDAGMHALRTLTPLFSAEFAVRHFIARDHARALRHLRAWSRDESEHVRRLVSEGTRPRLPWGKRVPWLTSHPKEVHALLEALKDDTSEYVRRSVANHLNDIAKTDAPAVLRTLGRWAKGAPAKRAWIIKHASRTLIKRGHADALALLGFSANAKIDVARLVVTPTRVREGNSVTITLELESRDARPLSLVVDYVVGYVKSNGQQSPKVFKWKTLTLPARGKITLTKQHAFKAVTTRKHYGGKHAISAQVNGKIYAHAAIDLRV